MTHYLLKRDRVITHFIDLFDIYPMVYHLNQLETYKNYKLYKLIKINNSYSKAHNIFYRSPINLNDIPLEIYRKHLKNELSHDPF